MRTIHHPDENPLHQLIYVSLADDAFDGAELAKLLEDARKQNAVAHVTGILLYIDHAFIQVLEGRERDVERAFGRIEAGAQHRKVRVLRRGPVDARQFGTWSMAYAAVWPEVGLLDGFRDHLSRTAADADLDEDIQNRVFQLLARFQDDAYSED